MAIWQLDIEKNLGTEYWTNVYYCNQPDQAGAVAAANFVAAQEQDFHLQAVQFTKFRVRPYPAGGASGTVYPLGYQGERIATDYLPLFNTVNVILAVAVGRPSRKYYRCPLDVEDNNGGNLAPASLAYFNAAIGEVFAAGSPANLCDESGQPILASGVVPTIGMRQLRRGSRRRVAPIF